MPITLKNRHQIEKMRSAGRLVAHTLLVVGEHVKPGVTTAELDQVAEEYIRKHGAVPSFKGYRGFPASICVSINEVICHGIPSVRRLEEGDIVGIDIGAILDGWHGDCCITFPVGRVDARSQKLLDVTREALNRGIEAAGPGKRLGDIGAAIQQYVESHGFSVVREYTGHGIGRKLHDEPTVLHYGTPNTGIPMRPGMVFTIEPMVNAGKPGTRLLNDGWTVVTADGSRSAQFEHTIAITDKGIEILSLP
ncbi:MAG: methionine aminopeptidase [Herpetosiphonaceae bacterium]|nr:MAG: methionine aminopeptidase [Herpetosiphonaceae bacterium]